VRCLIVIRTRLQDARGAHAAQDIYEQVRATYPNASIWFTGHSLGGSLSSLLAQTYGHPAFGYNSPGTPPQSSAAVIPAPLLTHRACHSIDLSPLRPGEQRYAERLGLRRSGATANGTAPYVFHFGNPGDVIMLGECELCWLFGYAIETQCHVGHVCMYNYTGFASVNMHRLSVNLEEFITVEPPPPCILVENCTDCGEWQYL